MQNPFQPNLRTPWILLCVSTLLVYCITPFRRETMFQPDAISTWLELLLFVLSFPFGAIFFILLDTPGLSIIGRFLLWSMSLTLGYAGWFHLLPALLARRPARVTTLNLSPGGNVAFAAAPPADSAPRPDESPEPHQLRQADQPPVPQFDDRGHTPLERILRRDEPED